MLVKRMTNQSHPRKTVYKPNPSQEQTGKFFIHKLVPKLWIKERETSI